MHLYVGLASLFYQDQNNENIFYTSDQINLDSNIPFIKSSIFSTTNIDFMFNYIVFML